MFPFIHIDGQEGKCCQYGYSQYYRRMIRPRTPRREQLGEFLSARRRSMSRTAVGLPLTARRSDTGLSREEVATLSGVSASWYTWLEQGRDINVSRQVLAAVCRVLDFTAAENAYVIALAEHDEEPAVERVERVPAHLQRMIDALDFPAFIVATDWAIVGWNARYEWLYPRIGSVEEESRNLLGLVYTDPQLREMLPDWERDSRRFLAEFRAESGVRLSSPRHRAVIDRLRGDSEDFLLQWAELTVERFTSRTRTFLHRDAGLVEFEHHRLVPSDAPDLHVVMYVPTTQARSA